MAREFDAAVPEYLESSTSPISDEPYTFACWFNPDSTATGLLVGIHDISSSSFSGNVIYVQAEVNGKLAGYIETSGITSTASYTSNTWQHAVFAVSSSDSLNLWLNGTKRTKTVTSRGVTGIDGINIAIADWNAGQARKYDGSIAEAAMWNTQLTDAEVAVLAAGYSASLVKPQNLKAYYKLLRGNDNNFLVSHNFTLQGTPTDDIHPPITYPPSSRVAFPFTVAGGAALPSNLLRIEKLTMRGAGRGVMRGTA